MYTLRTVTKTGVELNYCLGKKYSVIKEADSPEEFKELQSLTDGSNLNKITYGYVKDEYGITMPLHNVSKHYIVTESGSTLERL